MSAPIYPAIRAILSAIVEAMEEIEGGSVIITLTLEEAEAVGRALMSAKRRLRERGMRDMHAVDLLARLESAYLKLDQ